MTAVTCADYTCKFNRVGNCSRATISHTDERFCVDGRKKDRNETRDLMSQQNPNCQKTGSGYKSTHINVLK